MLQPATKPYRVVADVAVYDTEQKKEKVTTEWLRKSRGGEGDKPWDFVRTFGNEKS